MRVSVAMVYMVRLYEARTIIASVLSFDKAEIIIEIMGSMFSKIITVDIIALLLKL